jgi:predicted RNA-binding Zn-ribbon protein involved in translation (DUF1610 family)
MAMGHLKAEPHALAQYMSYLSQEAYRERWVRGLEYALWEVTIGERRQYGRASFSDEHAAAIRRLSEASGGWIVFDEEHDETWVTLSDWQARYQDWKRNSVEEGLDARSSPSQPSNAPYSRAELLAADHEQLPARGDLCPRCGDLVPRFGELTPELHAYLVSLTWETEGPDIFEELHKYTGAPPWLAKIWVSHGGEPQPRYPRFPCPHCGKPLPTTRSKQCLHCHADWH